MDISDDQETAYVMWAPWQYSYVCIWSSWCHCHCIISCFIKIRFRFKLSGASLLGLSWKRGR